MIANRWQIRSSRKEERCKRASAMGKASARSRAERNEGREIGPRPLPVGTHLKTLIIHDPRTDTCHRYEAFKSLAGKRKIDLVIDRGTRSEKRINAKSVTWLMDQLRQKMAVLPEICED
jgi:hypothetical protein